MENNDKDFFSDIELESDTSDENGKTPDSNPVQVNNTGLSEENVPVYPDIIDYSVPKPLSNEKRKSGLKLFALILAFVVLLSGGCLGGYFAGVNSIKRGNSNISLSLESKPTDTDAYTAAQVYTMVNKSIVGIVVYNASGKSSMASGVIYSEDGYIITNDHIYSSISKPQFRIYAYDGTEYDAQYIAGDTRSDLAVLKIDSNGFYPATFGNSDELVIGESVVAVGRPSTAQSDSSISTGTVSLTNRRVSITSSYSTKFIQTDAAINPGSSGGALLNMYGQVVGITSSKVTGSEYDRIGFAIPTTTVKRVAESLIKSGVVSDRARLGISYNMIDSITAKVNNVSTTGIYIAAVNDDSDLLNKVEVGDIITKINGKDITNDSVVLDIIDESRPGDVLELDVYTKSGAHKTVTATLLPDEGSSSYTTDTATQSTPESSSEFNFPYGN